MKKIILLFSLFFALITGAFAQRGQHAGGNVEAIKIGYFTKKLELTPEEAQRFWPVYNQYINEIRQVRLQNTDMDEVSLEEKIVNVRKKYKSEFSRAIPEEKVNTFFKADKEFTNYLRKELQDRNELRDSRKN
jgi:hypothetical protein